MKRIFPWSTIFKKDLESNSHEIISRNVNFRDYEFPFRKQQIEIIILRLPSKAFFNDLHSYLKSLMWTISFFFFPITSDKHPNYSTERSNKDMIPYDRQIVFQVYMIQLSA